MVMAPVLVMLPIDKLLPAVVDVMASLTATAKLVELPTTERFPFASAFTMTEALMLAVPVTVSVEPLILQFVPELPV
jgi:hypothetical protein